ncbi:uncharacterized protein [Macrobrachium rosenbergii]|uniref:uncharacterized protein n=1 Tax=Macrobrachium rosenbergii TaxID=79674 RepID=UPI0034D438FC
MPVKYITPGRANVVIGTAAVVMLFNTLFILHAPNDCEDYHLGKVLSGPEAQDSPSLLRWVRSQFIPPSRLPYNLSYIMNGFHEDDDGNELKLFSPSQEFILGNLEDIFGDKIEIPGTFLEVGAYDGEFLSNTLWLEREFGWKGILVEANPYFFEQLLLKHRRSWAINVCLNIKPYPSKEKFVMGSSSPVNISHLASSGEDDDLVEKHISQGSSGLKDFKNNETQIEGMMEVQCVPVYTVIKALGRTHIDFFSLDVERAEMGILDTIPWDKLSFSVLAIEHATTDDLVAYLDERGYAHVASQSEDHIFVNKADRVLKEKHGGL